MNMGNKCFLLQVLTRQSLERVCHKLGNEFHPLRPPLCPRLLYHYVGIL